MTSELKDQLNQRIGELIAAMTPGQREHVQVNGRYQQIPWTVDVGWMGEGLLEFSVTEYVGPSELPEDHGVEKPGAEGLARFTDIDGTRWTLCKDFSMQPSRNHDWQLQGGGSLP